MAALKHVIVPTGHRASYPMAHMAARTNGGLPSHVPIDDFLLERYLMQELAGAPTYFTQLDRMGYTTAWIQEGLAYPTTGRKFKRGRDIVDSFEGPQGFTWVLPASSVPSEAFGTHGIGLFFSIQNLEKNGSLIVVETDPDCVVVLEKFMQRSGWGRVHEGTRIPLKTKSKTLERLHDAEKRYLLRTNLRGVRPLARSISNASDWRTVYANLWTYLPLDIAHARELRPVLRPAQG